MVAGQYSIDYYRKRIWKIPVGHAVSEVVFPFATYKAQEVPASLGKVHSEITLEGAERLHKTITSSLVLDDSGKEVSIKQLPSAPSEKEPDVAMKHSCIKEVPEDLELSILRTRIQKRPSDVSWISTEVFEVSERVVFYVPRYRITFRQEKTGKERVAEFDGVTGRLVRTGDSRLVRHLV
jgi:hypothetical protein